MLSRPLIIARCVAVSGWLFTQVIAVFAGPIQEPESVPAPRSDPVFRIATEGGRDTFRMGEIIPVELHFTSVSNRYQVYYFGCYERIGQVDLETVFVQPREGWTDPLRSYFVRPRVMMHPRTRAVEKTSFPIELELNQWVRFDSPGSYRLRITSRRVCEPGANRFAEPCRFVELSSNEITIRVVSADKRWQETSYKEASAVLGDVRNSDGGQASTTQRMRAIKTLRYLGTVVAARELIRLLPDDAPSGDCLLGLIGSPVGKRVVPEIERLITIPDYPVSGSVLRALAFLRLPADLPDNAVEVRADEEQTEVLPAILAAVDRKQGRALAETTATLLLWLRDTSPEDKTRLTRHLVSSFHYLSGQTQALLLEHLWDRLDHQVMLPVLRQLAASQGGKDTGRRSVGDAAVRRLSELAPDEAPVPR